MKPTIVVQLPTREKVVAFRAGVGDQPSIVALGLDPASFTRVAGLDALYMSLTRAERWGSRPLPPYRAAILTTSEADQRDGMPRYVLTGMVLKNTDPNTAAFCVPRLMKAVLEAIDQVNAATPGTIRTIGFFEFELKFPGSSLMEVGRLFAEALT